LQKIKNKGCVAESPPLSSECKRCVDCTINSREREKRERERERRREKRKGEKGEKRKRKEEKESISESLLI